MIQRHEQMLQQADVFNKGLSGKGFIQKIYSTTSYVCIILRFPGATKYLYLGRGGGHEGLWVGRQLPRSELRVRDRFLEYLRKHLTSAALRSLQLDPCDRILTLAYDKKGHLHILQLFWSGRDLYFLNCFLDPESGQRRVFLSWQGERAEGIQFEGEEQERELGEKLKNYFLPVGRKTAPPSPRITDRGEGEAVGSASPPAVEAPRGPKGIDELLQEEWKRVSHDKTKKKALKALERKRERIQADLIKNELWQKLQQFLQNEDLNLEKYSMLTLWGFEFHFDGEANHFKRRDLIFQKIKKLKRGEQIQRERLNQVESEIAAAKSKAKGGNPLSEGHQGQVVGRSPIKIISPVWPVKKSTRSQQASGPLEGKIQEYRWGRGIRLGVGKSDSGNDYLRNSWAAKEDLWFHLDQYKSAHAVVKLPPQVSLDLQDYRLIGSIIADCSQANLSLIPLVYTAIKNIKGVKGAPGKVTMKKPRHLQVEYQGDWRKLVMSD